jgi:Zn finger protein HypA/HybF involved in hydrogenase expression
MSAIITLKCTNPECTFGVSLHLNSPIWKDGTPSEEMMLPANPDYVLETTSEEVCLSCKKVVKVENATYICPNCASAHTFLKRGDTCPKCNKGNIEEDEKMKVWF